ncbi:dephospho-CoA kinase [Kineococcus sp. SYSU DK005]|uniref:dephospho-CoA kinase n=1 Tax=Kineococcus sp. SYSU DK005 TaxID=3383126 RepID=UPI003D7E35D8
MLRVGLTGGIGAGKSTVAAHLVRLGAVLVDADVIAREVVAPGTAGLGAVVERFGPGVLRQDGALDRPALGRLVFADDAARADLNALVHPLVAARREELVAAAPPGAVVVEDVPLLVETGLAARFPLVIVVHAGAGERLRRLVADRGMSEQDARARVAAQAGDEERLAAADVVLDNPRRDPGAADPLPRRVERLWRERLLPFEENVRLGRPAPAPPGPPGPADPAWPAQAARLAARVARAAGDLQRGVEHVGATAVPGAAARDVLDLQLAVPSAAAVPRVAGALAAAGFPPARAGGGAGDDPGGDDAGGGGGGGALHASADPGRPVRLHVRVHGSPAWRRALLLRDSARAGGGPGGAHALDGLDATGSAVAAAEEWARRTGWHPPGA